MKKLSASALLVVSIQAGAQDYCAPFFANGCFNWRTFEVQAGSLLWSPGADDCWTGIYTQLSTSVDAGTALPMSVTNGVWCGVAVWVDLDQSGSFEASENLYFTYVGGAPSYQYDFSITIPAGTPSGAYRMRIISPWGSDGFTTENGNGNGPCGFYQYGDFKDFALDVNGTLGVVGPEAQGLTLAPNPAHGVVLVSGLPINAEVRVLDPTGRTMHLTRSAGDRLAIDAAGWPAGPYALRVAHAGGIATRRLIVD